MNRIYTPIITAVLAGSAHALAAQSHADDKLVAPALAAEIASNLHTARYVADDLEIATLPNGGVVPRLVSREGLTARQFWTRSTYPQGFILVFQGQGELTRSPNGPDSRQKSARQIPPNERAPNDPPDFLIQALQRK